ncbi:MAG: hypothetical protein ABSG37_09290 [Candidatus Limnocylindrales bacterium]
MDRLDEIIQARGWTNEKGGTGLSDRLLEELRATDATLAILDVDYADWEVLYRMRLQIERDLLVGCSVGQAWQPGGET